MENRQEAIKRPLRIFMSNDFRATRKALGLTQAQMAEALAINIRSYIHLEKGENLCSTPVFIRYLGKFKQIEDVDQDGNKITRLDTKFLREACYIVIAADNMVPL